MNEGVAVHELMRDDQGRPVDYRIIAVNPSFERIIGLSASKVLFKTSREAYDVADAPFLDKYSSVVDTGRPVSFESYFPPMDKYFRINAFCSEPGIFATVFSDITDQVYSKKSLEKTISERDILLKELYHRTKNNLQLVSGLIILERESMKDAEHREVLTALERKIQSIAVVHRKLYESRSLERIDLKEYLEELVPSVVSAILPRENQIKIQLDCVSVEAGIDAAIAIGLIVNELLHNAVKYAVPDGAEKVLVRLSEKKDAIELCVSDDGPGLPPDFEDRRARSTGLELADTLVRERLKGAFDFGSDKGAVCRAVFPSSALE